MLKDTKPTMAGNKKEPRNSHLLIQNNCERMTMHRNVTSRLTLRLAKNDS